MAAGGLPGDGQVGNAGRASDQRKAGAVGFLGFDDLGNLLHVGGSETHRADCPEIGRIVKSALHGERDVLDGIRGVLPHGNVHNVGKPLRLEQHLHGIVHRVRLTKTSGLDFLGNGGDGVGRNRRNGSGAGSFGVRTHNKHVAEPGRGGDHLRNADLYVNNILDVQTYHSL